MRPPRPRRTSRKFLWRIPENANAVKKYFNGVNEQLKPVDANFGKHVVGPLGSRWLWTGDWQEKVTDDDGEPVIA